MNYELNKSVKAMDGTQEPPAKLRRTASQDTVASNVGMSSQLVDSIDAIFKPSSSSANNSSSTEAQDLLRLQEGQEKLTHAYKIIQSLRKKIAAKKKEASEINAALENETMLNETLKNKSASALKLTESFNDHINYINDTLIRTKERAKTLEETYYNEIVPLLNDKEKLSKQFDELNQALQSEDEKFNEEAERMKLEIEKTKVNNQILNDELLKLKEKNSKAKYELMLSDKTIADMKITQDKLKNRAEELKQKIDEQEKRRLEMINNFPETDKIKETRQYYENKLSLARDELNKVKFQLNSMREEKEEVLQKYKEKEKYYDDLDKKNREILLQITENKNKTTKANVELQQVDEENENIKKKIDDKKHELLIIEDKLVSMTREKSDLNDKINNLKKKVEKTKEKNNKLKHKLEEMKTQLTEIEQSKTNTDKDLKEYQEIKESKVLELQKKIKSMKERWEKALIESEELKADKQKLEKDHEKYLKEQDDQYQAHLFNLEKQMALNNTLAAELSVVQSSLHSRETDSKNLKEKIAKNKKDLESKLKKTEELLTKRKESENQLIEEKNKLEAKMKEVEEECKKLKETHSNVCKLQKSQSNLEPRIQTRVKPTFSSSQSQIESTEDGQRNQMPKSSSVLENPPKSPGKKSTSNFLSSDSDDDTKKQSFDVNGLLETLRISQSPEKSSITSPSTETSKRNL